MNRNWLLAVTFLAGFLSCLLLDGIANHNLNENMFQFWVLLVVWMSVAMIGLFILALQKRG